MIFFCCWILWCPLCGSRFVTRSPLRSHCALVFDGEWHSYQVNYLCDEPSSSFWSAMRLVHKTKEETNLRYTWADGHAHRQRLAADRSWVEDSDKRKCDVQTRTQVGETRWGILFGWKHSPKILKL